MLYAFKISSERAACDQLGDEHNLFSFADDPRRDEVNDIVMFQMFDEIDFFHDALLLAFGKVL